MSVLPRPHAPRRPTGATPPRSDRPDPAPAPPHRRTGRPAPPSYRRSAPIRCAPASSRWCSSPSLVAVPLLVVKATHTIANSKAGRTVDVARRRRPVACPNTPAAAAGDDRAPTAPWPGSPCSPSTARGRAARRSSCRPAPRSPRGDGQPGTRLGDAYADGGLAAEREAVEGVLGITTSVAEEVDEAALAALLQPYAPIHVTLDDPRPRHRRRRARRWCSTRPGRRSQRRPGGPAARGPRAERERDRPAAAHDGDLGGGAGGRGAGATRCRRRSSAPAGPGRTVAGQLAAVAARPLGGAAAAGAAGARRRRQPAGPRPPRRPTTPP